jgi:hypothetical protein
LADNLSQEELVRVSSDVIAKSLPVTDGILKGTVYSYDLIDNDYYQGVLKYAKQNK